MRIETERLVITEFTMDMAQAVHENSLDGDNRRFVPDEVFETVEEARETIAFLMSQYGGTGGPLAYPVLVKAGGENAGSVQLVPLDGGIGEIGYHIAKLYTRQGYASEALNLFLGYLKSERSLHEVWGIALSTNKPSRKVLEKCGFQTVYDGEGLYQGKKRKIVKTIRKL